MNCLRLAFLACKRVSSPIIISLEIPIPIHSVVGESRVKLLEVSEYFGSRPKAKPSKQGMDVIRLDRVTHFDGLCVTL
jgi:hypothetical protein